MNAKFQIGDKAMFGKELVRIAAVVEITPTQFDYTVILIESGETEICDESELSIYERIIPLTFAEYNAIVVSEQRAKIAAVESSELSEIDRLRNDLLESGALDSPVGPFRKGEIVEILEQGKWVGPFKIAETKIERGEDYIRLEGPYTDFELFNDAPFNVRRIEGN